MTTQLSLLDVTLDDATARRLGLPGATSAELAEYIAKTRGEDYGEWRSRVARRLPELAVLHVKRGPSRTCRVTGSTCVTWEPA